jgi:hypothetical protein
MRYKEAVVRSNVSAPGIVADQTNLWLTQGVSTVLDEENIEFTALDLLPMAKEFMILFGILKNFRHFLLHRVMTIGAAEQGDISGQKSVNLFPVGFPPFVLIRTKNQLKISFPTR